MNTHTITFITTRFFALFILYQLLLSSVYQIPLKRLTLEEVTPFLLVTGYGLVMFMIFWFKAHWIADKIVGKYADKGITSEIKVEDALTIGFTIIGALFLFNAILQSLHVTAYYFMAEQRDIGIDNYVRLGSAIIIGILLIFGANGMSSIITKLRGR